METVLDLGGMHVDVIRKDIKNLHLSVHPPTGRVRIAAPKRASMDAIRAFAISSPLDQAKPAQDQNAGT